MGFDQPESSLQAEEPIKTIPKISEETACEYVIAALEMGYNRGYDKGKKDVEAKAKIADIQRKAQEDLVSRIGKQLGVEPSQITILGDFRRECVGYEIQRNALGFGRDLEVPVYRNEVPVSVTIPVYDKRKKVTERKEVVGIVKLSEQDPFSSYF